MTEPMRFPNGLDVRYEHKNVAAKNDCFTESWVHRLSSEIRSGRCGEKIKVEMIHSALRGL